MHFIKTAFKHNFKDIITTTFLLSFKILKTIKKKKN